MASQDEETKQMMRTLIEQQAEMIRLMRMSTSTITPPPPNPSSVPRPTFLPPSRPTFCPPTTSTHHHRSTSNFRPQPPLIPHPRPPRPSQARHDPTPHRPHPNKARIFSFWKPASEILFECINKGILKPLPPQPLRYPLPPSFDMSRHCAFHQIMGHSTDDCRKLKYAIQDLIDGGVLMPPKEHTNPTSAATPQPPSPLATHAQGGESASPTRKRKRYQG